MNTTEEQRRDAVDQDVAGGESGTVHIPIAEYVTAVWQHRRWLSILAGVGVLLAVCIALLTPNEYSSTAQLMPPDWRPPSGSSLLGAIAGGGGGSIEESLAGEFMGDRTPGATYIGILGSQTVEDAIIHRFDLKSVYGCKLDVDARKQLEERTAIVEAKKSGIISVTVTDQDRYRARNIAAAYVQELDNLVDSLSTSSARRERVFLEGRLKSIKADLDTSSQALSQFSSRNATLDLQRQGEATVEAAGKLQGELISAQSELSGLKAAYADGNVLVREAQRRVDVLQTQLNKMTGAGTNTGANDFDSGQTLPSIRELPLLGLNYYDLSRQVAMDEALYETLTKQYELARVQEAEEILPIEVLDPPIVPERKSGPKRRDFVYLGFFFSLFVGIAWIVASKKWELTDDTHPAKALGILVLRSVRRRKSVGSN